MRQTARIVVPTASAAALPVAQDLADYLRPATGYSLPVVTGSALSGDIQLILGDPGGLQSDPDGEGYLNGNPQDINCSANNPPWDYTPDVGISALCPASTNTWAIMTAIIDQLAAMSPGPYYDIGGD